MGLFENKLGQLKIISKKHFWLGYSKIFSDLFKNNFVPI